MKPIIFARIADMEYYRGKTATDEPKNGGAYVKENHDGGECHNFHTIESNSEEFCLGYVRLIGNSSNSYIQLKLENIVGCDLCNKEESIDGVTVVWCATQKDGKSIRVVGFYKNATVYRYPQQANIIENDGSESLQEYNFVAKKEDCVLIPLHDRYTKSEWYIPLSGKHGYNFGFGRSNIWFANSKEKKHTEQEFVERMIKNIENYIGKNLMDEEVV